MGTGYSLASGRHQAITWSCVYPESYTTKQTWTLCSMQQHWEPVMQKVFSSDVHIMCEWDSPDTIGIPWEILQRLPCNHYHRNIARHPYISRFLKKDVWMLPHPMASDGDNLGQSTFNSLRPRQNGRRFADDTFKYIFLNQNAIISAKISLKFVPKGPIDNIPALVQIMAWRRPGDKSLSEPMMVRLPTHICVTRPQWVNSSLPGQNGRHFADILKRIFMNENFYILIQISLKFVPKGPIDNKSALVQVMACPQTGDKPFPEPMLTQFTYIYTALGEMS